MLSILLIHLITSQLLDTCKISDNLSTFWLVKIFDNFFILLMINVVDAYNFWVFDMQMKSVLKIFWTIIKHFFLEINWHAILLSDFFCNVSASYAFLWIVFYILHKHSRILAWWLGGVIHLVGFYFVNLYANFLNGKTKLAYLWTILGLHSIRMNIIELNFFLEIVSFLCFDLLRVSLWYKTKM